MARVQRFKVIGVAITAAVDKLFALLRRVIVKVPWNGSPARSRVHWKRASFCLGVPVSVLASKAADEAFGGTEKSLRRQIVRRCEARDARIVAADLFGRGLVAKSSQRSAACRIPAARIQRIPARCGARVTLLAADHLLCADGVHVGVAADSAVVSCHKVARRVDARLKVETRAAAATTVHNTLRLGCTGA